MLTASRVAVLPAFVFAVVFADWVIAAALFTIAAVSDFFDGKLARAYGQSSPVGGLFDHASDAAFVSAGCAALATSNLVNAALAWLILIAFMQYMLDSRALAGRSLRTSFLGRHNGIGYFILLGTGVGAGIFQWPWLDTTVWFGSWVLVLTTLASIADRFLSLLSRGSRV